MSTRELTVLFLFLIKLKCSLCFVIPDVTLEAFEPKGFRASIPALDGIQMFAFHANINKEINQVEEGDYNGDTTTPTDNLWSYFNETLTLKVGDQVNYWIFIQNENLGYRRDNQVWQVPELIKMSDSSCITSDTAIVGKTHICNSSLIFEDNFDKSQIDSKKWTLEQYIPTYKSTDYEFVSYQSRKDVCYTNGGKLFIKPKVAQDEREVSGELDLRGKCTKNTDDECYARRATYLILPPVTSARLVSKFKFRFGKIEVKAKLPAGDWIYPQLYLEQANNPLKKLWIAYARGNEKLIANSQEDIGGTLLFGGPVLDPTEPNKSQYLKTKKNNVPYFSEVHTYTLIWHPEYIVLQVDGAEYGRIDKEIMDELQFSKNEMVQLVFGVGVGGINDFPNDYSSGSNKKKPWINMESKQVKKFFAAKNTWIDSWKIATDSRALQIDYVKIWAL